MVFPNDNLDICHSRTDTMLRTLRDYNRHVTQEGIHALISLTPWLACTTGSALSRFMDNLKRGTAYMYNLEEVISEVTYRRKLALMERVQGCFLSHILRKLGCTPEISCSNFQYYLPMGLEGKINNADTFANFREAIDSFPSFSLGGNKVLTDKQLWSFITRGIAPLPKSAPTGSAATQQGQNKKTKNICSYVQELLKGYGFEWVYKTEVDRFQGRKC